MIQQVPWCSKLEHLLHDNYPNKGFNIDGDKHNFVGVILSC